MQAKNKSSVITASGVVGTSGVPGYIRSVNLFLASAAGSISIYDGTSAAGTLKYHMTCPNTAGYGQASPPLSIYCASGIYCAVSNCYATVEYDGC